MSTKRNPDRSSHGDAVATGNALGHRPVLVPFWLVLESMAAMIRSTIGVTRVTLWWWRQEVTS